MQISQRKEAETIQRVITQTVATHPAGRNLVLIGGFRFRFLDKSVRISDDIDYHWKGDLGEKQKELIDLFSRVLLPEMRRRFGYDGSVAARHGPDADSPVVRVVDIAFWKEGIPHSRIEIPVELTRIACADPVAIRTAGGTIYATASDGDMIESKVLAILNRSTLRHRDIVDIFLFQDRFLPDSRGRLAAKLRESGIISASVEKRLADIRTHKDYHGKAIQAVIDAQFDPNAAAQINDAGGGRIVLDAAMKTLEQYVPVRAKESDESN
ncbi:hypothetical protein ACFLQR_01430 [Verrucomicrobiota bacterium]